MAIAGEQRGVYYGYALYDLQNERLIPFPEIGTGNGEEGPQGPQGPVGPKGDQGDRGTVGPAGLIGDRGDEGPVGVTGPAGTQGPAGVQGPSGIQGEEGPVGPPGPPGPEGISGPQGPRGEQGVAGTTGLLWKGEYVPGTQYLPNDAVSFSGETYFNILPSLGVTPGRNAPASQSWALLAAAGSPGPEGISGPQGPRGEKGEVGLRGVQGVQGVAGPQGLTGLQGPAGTQGQQGLRGDTGLTGPKGDQGPAGARGEKGDTGLQGPSPTVTTGTDTNGWDYVQQGRIRIAKRTSTATLTSIAAGGEGIITLSGSPVGYSSALWKTDNLQWSPGGYAARIHLSLEGASGSGVAGRISYRNVGTTTMSFTITFVLQVIMLMP